MVSILLCRVLFAESPSNVPAAAAEAPPLIDGRLDDPAWRGAAVISELTQVEPVPGSRMSEATEVRILYDQTAIYLGIQCFDREPSGIRARGRERDGSVLVGDYVAFFFDTFHDRRNGYAFAVSPDEGRWDALVSNHFTANTDWDGTWQARCRTDAHGWTAEIAIPFKTLSYDAKGETWGLNISRSIARKGETGRWAWPRPESKLHYAGNAGTLTGLKDLPKNLGLEVSPYALARRTDQRGEDSCLTGDVGLDVRWRVNPGLTATLSLNTDFAETEVDQRQINFTRFPLFFPEKRDFFLEDSGIYRFADLNEVLVFLAYLGTLYQPLNAFSQGAGVFHSASVQIARVFEILDEPVTIADAPDALKPVSVRGEIEFDHVTFAYEKDRPALDDVSFRVEAGQVLALVGRTGSGKSTTASLLLRFYDPDRGVVRLDGHDLRSLNLEWLRSHVSIVFQEPFLFSATIRENIAAGKPDASDEAIRLAARRAQADDFIHALPEGYDTLLGERGVNLSGGQRQRISIARAFLKDAPVLILDEPTSALDAATERELLGALEELMAGRTTIIIAHRLSTIRRADRIGVFENGRMVEFGNHAELMAQQGVFYDLATTQEDLPESSASVA